MFQHSGGRFCQKLPSSDRQKCCCVVVQQPAVVGPQLWLLSRNRSLQRLEHLDVVCSSDSMPAWYPVFQNYNTTTAEECDDHGFCLQFGHPCFLRSRFFWCLPPHSAVAFQDRMQKSNFRRQLSHDRKHPNFLTTLCKCRHEFPSVHRSNFSKPISRTFFTCSIL